MRRGIRIAALPALLVSVCIAQQPTGPQTLETLLQQAEEPQQPQGESAPTAETKPTKPHTQGTYLRPEEGVQHPDLDKAWATYDYAVTQANTSITAALTQLFDAAADKGDLDAADKWQALRDKFQKESVLPEEKETQAIAMAAIQAIKSANDELRNAYDQLVKSLTKEKKIAEAKTVRDEWKTLEKDHGDVPTIAGGEAQPGGAPPPARKPPAKPAKPPKLKPVVYRFANEDAIKKDWDFTTNEWQIVDNVLGLSPRCRVRAKLRYEGDFKVSVAYKDNITVIVCGMGFWQHAGQASVIERRGKLLTVWNSTEPQPKQVQLKDEQLGPTTIELSGTPDHASGLIGVEILGTPVTD